MSDKRIVSIQLTKTKSVVAVEIGKNEYVDADGVTYKNIDTDFISDADDVSEEEKHTFKYLSSLYDGIAELEEQKCAIDAKIAASKKEIKAGKHVMVVYDEYIIPFHGIMTKAYAEMLAKLFLNTDGSMKRWQVCNIKKKLHKKTYCIQ